MKKFTLQIIIIIITKIMKNKNNTHIKYRNNNNTSQITITIRQHEVLSNKSNKLEHNRIRKQG